MPLVKTSPLRGVGPRSGPTRTALARRVIRVLGTQPCRATRYQLGMRNRSTLTLGASAPRPLPLRGERSQRSFNCDLRGLRLLFPLIIDEPHDQRAAGSGHRGKCQERIGRNGGEEFGTQHLLAVPRADEAVDDVARDASPCSSRRCPLSIGCEISSFTSNGSPRFTCFGTLISTRTIASGPVDASGERHDQVHAVAPAASVGQLRHCDHRLRRRQPDARRYPRRSRTRTEYEAHDVRQRVALGEHVDAAHRSAQLRGASTLTVIATVLPFSTMTGRSSLTRPRAPPRHRPNRGSDQRPARVLRARSDWCERHDQPAAGQHQEAAAGDHGERRVIRNATTSSICSAVSTGRPCHASPTRSVRPSRIGRHKRVGIQLARIDQTQANLAFGQARSDAVQRRGDAALQMRIGKRPGMA